MPHDVVKTVQEVPAAIISAAASLLGIGLLIAWSDQLSRRQLVLIISSGLTSAAFVPPFLVGWITHTSASDWLPAAEYLYSAAGFLCGLVGVKLVAAILAFASGVEGAAGRAGDRIGGEK